MSLQFKLSLSLTVASHFFISNAMAAEKNAPPTVTYTRPPFAAFSSQMQDGLSGGGKYEKPVWNLRDALKLPNWLSLSVEQRTRYESLDGSVKANGKGGDQQIPLQLDVALEARLGQWRLGGEFLDAREIGADTGSGVNNTHVNNADFIQGYLAWANQNLNYSGIGVEVIAGRQSLNLGSRRLVARNVFRNTINSFTGGKLRITDYSHWQFTSFVTLPVNRDPSTATDILNDVHRFDEENGNTLFSGGFLELYNLPWNINSELYLYHLDESDSATAPTRNRRYFTPGARLFIKPAKGKFDFQLESIGQIGTVRATTNATDNKDLQHLAWMQHVDAGYTFDAPWTPRVAFEYDYISGDDNPNDGKDQRFDTLYGARRFDFGPTGIYGAFARTNLNTPSLRITAAPREDVQLTLNHRAFWLASATDSWGSLQDKSGRSGDFIGQQLELTARYDFNSSLNFEAGWTHLFKGEFAKRAPSAPNGQDVDYFYVQTLLRF
ncbi:MAG: alginate export family protein [Methylococcaceae bacterium]|nr:alginate export family protein [Methylococcaceae bacterium]